MSTIVPLSPPDARGLHQLCTLILRNRFLPVPPPEGNSAGDGGFLEVGVEFLRWFVELGALSPRERVLDLGCGVGRMALPMTQYLQGGFYEGLDVSASAIAWCRQAISGPYPEFRFTHIDLVHPIYNPDGRARTEGTRLPCADASQDFVVMTSVATHLNAAELAAYAGEIRRVMAPGGRLFLTAFLLNPPAREGLASGRGPLRFDLAPGACEVELDPSRRGAAVAFDEDHLLALFLAAGLKRTRPAVYGRWSGRNHPGLPFQDINVFEIMEGPGS